ncbi:MAG: alpha/beta hydrolase [Syntrophaceae bacterium]|nr:alpha/beta hydrolase [Syntrophaceae bacterium]
MESKSIFINANGIRFHCITAGEGPLCLCLHGFPDTRHSWRNQVPLLAKAFKVVVPDMRGYGQTDAPRKVADYRLPVLMKDIKCLIEALGYEKAVIVAHDWGAVIAIHYCETYPETVSKLVWSNSLHIVDFYDALLRKRSLRQILKSWYIYANQIPWMTEIFLSAANYFFLEVLMKIYVVRKEVFTEDVIKNWKDVLRQSGLRGGVNYYRAGRWAFFEIAAGRFKAGRIKCPVKVIWGNTDRSLNIERGLALRNLVDSDFDFYIVKNCGHWVQQEAPEEFNDQLADFLGIK